MLTSTSRSMSMGVCRALSLWRGRWSCARQRCRLCGSGGTSRRRRTALPSPNAGACGCLSSSRLGDLPRTVSLVFEGRTPRAHDRRCSVPRRRPQFDAPFMTAGGAGLAARLDDCRVRDAGLRPAGHVDSTSARQGFRVRHAACSSQWRCHQRDKRVTSSSHFVRWQNPKTC